MGEGKEKNGKTASIVAVIIAFTVIVGLVVGGIIFLTKSKNEVNSPQPDGSSPTRDPITGDPTRENDEVVSAKVRLSVIRVNADGSKDLICGVMEGEIEGTKKDPPTVLQATCEILEENGISYTVDESIGRITSIKNHEERTDSGAVYGWNYKVNGEDATELASAAEVHDGDYIVYYLETWSIEDDVTETSGTNP